MRSRLRNAVVGVCALGVLTLALTALHRELAQVHYGVAAAG